MNKKNERMRRLLEIIRVRGFVPVKELAALMNVSEMTIRRDLKILEANRPAENVCETSVYHPARGVSPDGVRLFEDHDLLGSVRRRESQKEEIGRCAAALADPGDLIILDAGTTTEKIIPHLPAGLELTVLCYTMNLLLEARRRADLRIILAGGYYHPDTQMFESAQGADFIRSIRAQKAFVSAAGIHGRLGVTCMNRCETSAKRAALDSSLEKILVADSEKFGAVCPAYFSELDDFCAVVTDGGLSSFWREKITGMGITLHIAGER